MMLRRVVIPWAYLAALATAICLLIYLVTQQIWRHSANDPQIQLARDAASALGGGKPADAVVPREPVDMEQSLAPFLTVFDEAGRIVASSGRLRGTVPQPPRGVLDYVRERGEQRVTWQPQQGVRIASVVVRYVGSPHGFVMAGRSLAETEHRIEQFQQLIAIGWLAILGGLFVVVAAGAWLAPDGRGGS